jgi:hypothetical protein
MFSAANPFLSRHENGATQRWTKRGTDDEEEGMSKSPSNDRSRHPSTPSFPFGLMFPQNDHQDMRFLTKRGYEFGEVSSAMQKAIRHGDTRLAGYWALELWASGYGNYPDFRNWVSFDPSAPRILWLRGLAQAARSAPHSSRCFTSG